jgi:arylformamidase
MRVAGGRRRGRHGAVRYACSTSSMRRRDFGLDIHGSDISDKELAEAIVYDLRLLMVKEVRILKKEIVEEPHKRG